MASINDNPEITVSAFYSAICQPLNELLLLEVNITTNLPPDSIIARPLMGGLLSLSTRLSELCDFYGARYNEDCYRLRHLFAVSKLFADVGYNVLHIRQALSGYKLLATTLDLPRELERSLAFVSDALVRIGAEIIHECQTLGFTLPTTDSADVESIFSPTVIGGHLPANRINMRVCSAEQTVVRLATMFLHLASEAEFLHEFNHMPSSKYHDAIPLALNEELLRQLECKFHNLQSNYDTYVADTNTEIADADLLYLRGHVTLIFHLLQNATRLCHYFERHLEMCQSEGNPLISCEELLSMIIDGPIKISSIYLRNAVVLAQKMLSRYAEKGSIVVPIPKYRGFHVRPSTLVAKICIHYGSEVKMILHNEEYDATTPLDLFRANEYINAMKRRQLAAEISTMDLRPYRNCRKIKEAVSLLLCQLTRQNKLVIYEHPICIDEALCAADKDFAQTVMDTIAQLAAAGKIDIESCINITFVGDLRVLRDLQILAACGYGEDAIGNNVPLPSELAYLRREYARK